MNDFELVRAAKAGDEAAAAELFARHRGLILGISQQFFILGADRDDVIQEARIGFWKGIRDYEPTRGTLIQFLGLCVRRQVITGMKTAGRMKHEALNDRFVDVVADENGDLLQLFETVPDPRADAIEQLAGRDEFRSVVDEIGRLTELERSSLVGVVFEGRTYNDVEGLPPGAPKAKRVDNAIERARTNLRRRLVMPVPPTMAAAA